MFLSMRPLAGYMFLRFGAIWAKGGIPKVVPPLLHQGTLGAWRAGTSQSNLEEKKMSEN